MQVGGGASSRVAEAEARLGAELSGHLIGLGLGLGGEIASGPQANNELVNKIGGGGGLTDGAGSGGGNKGEEEEGGESDQRHASARHRVPRGWLAATR
ncbi:MAG: hypothetical protein OHK0015_27280 [Chloroflexi bacterium OHK40]